MANTFLSPLGDYTAVGSFCGLKGDPFMMPDFVLAVDAAAEEVRARCGPVLMETGLTFSHRLTYSKALVLPFRLAALTSITAAASGVLLTLADFHLDGQLVRRVDGGMIPACTVVYTSGWETPPARLVTAGMEIVRQYWRPQLGNQRTSDDPQGRAWSVAKLAERYIPPDYLLAPLGFA